MFDLDVPSLLFLDDWEQDDLIQKATDAILIGLEHGIPMDDIKEQVFDFYDIEDGSKRLRIVARVIEHQRKWGSHR